MSQGRSVSWAAVVARRLRRHRLAEPTPDETPADVVAAMCGAHAQVLTAAEWSIGLRIDGISRAGVRDALWGEHTLVKTFGPRGTVHLLPTHQLPMWIGALSSLPPLGNGLPPEARMTPDQLEAVIEAIGDALADAELTPEELDVEVVARAGKWAGDPVVPAWYGRLPRWRPAVYPAAYRGVLCFGANKGRKITYTSPRRWLPGLSPDDGQRAVAQLLWQYLHAYGPATPHHFARWLAVPPRWAVELFESLCDELHEVDLDGMPAWVVAGDAEMPAPNPSGVRLLPYFDAYTVGCHPRERLFPGEAAARALSGGQAGNFPVLLVNGVVAGVWHQRRSGRKIDVTVEPLRPLSQSRHRALDEQVQRLGEFLEGDPKLTIGKVTVGGHA